MPVSFVDLLRSSSRWLALVLALAAIVAVAPAAHAFGRPEIFSFDLVAPDSVASCLPHARGKVRLISHGENQLMDLRVSGLPANVEFAVFLLQVPRFPFGLSWYQGDVGTDRRGNGHAVFSGIFSDESFIIAPDVAPAPVVHPADAATNPKTAPVHTYHLGLWFESPADSVAAGCAANVTPFNGEHDAGILVLNTANFADEDGPIGQFTP
jgi:hypothetical protein